MDSRRTGRSLAIATALVRRAARDPGQTVRYGDLPFEVPRGNWQQTVVPYVQSLIASDPELSPHVTYHREYFRLDLNRPITDWWPPESYMGQWWPPGGLQEHLLRADGELSPEDHNDQFQAAWEGARVLASTTVEGSIEEVARRLAHQLQTPEGEAAMEQAAAETRQQLVAEERQLRSNRRRRHIMLGPPTTVRMERGDVSTREARPDELSRLNQPLATRPPPGPRANRYELLSQED